MNPLKIDIPFDKDNFIRTHLIMWEIHWRKNRKQLISILIMSLIVLFLGIIVRTEKEPTNPFIASGVLILILALYLTIRRIFSKQNYTRKIKDLANKYDSIKMDCSYEFSEESIKYQDKEKKIELNWSVFTNYTIYKDCLVLFLDNLAEFYVFEKKEIDAENYNKILEIVKSKLEYKKIK